MTDADAPDSSPRSPPYGGAPPHKRRVLRRWTVLGLSVVGITLIVCFALPPVLHWWREQQAEEKSKNNLQRIAHAMLEYDADRELQGIPPVAIFDQDGKPLLSWRVLLLPALGEQNLYQQFHLDEPWDSEHNIKLLPRIPEVYRTPISTPGEEHLTYYRVFVGKRMLFPPDGKPYYNFGNITDGAMNTILVVEAGTPVPWTKPEELEYNPKTPLPGMGGMFPDSSRFRVVMVDGAVRTITRSKITEKELRLLIDPADGLPRG